MGIASGIPDRILHHASGVTGSELERGSAVVRREVVHLRDVRRNERVDGCHHLIGRQTIFLTGEHDAYRGAAQVSDITVERRDIAGRWHFPVWQRETFKRYAIESI
jgi:hypothetical protein